MLGKGYYIFFFIFLYSLKETARRTEQYKPRQKIYRSATYSLPLKRLK